MSNNKILLVGLVITIGFAAFLFWPKNEIQNEQFATSTEPNAEGKIEVIMYKNEGCDCCTEWAKHMNEDKYAVVGKSVDNLSQIKRASGVPPRLESCHTAMIGEYFVEGHVPVEDVNRLLEEKPENAIGLTVPGMPIGSPGMEVPGRPADKYDVYLVNKDGTMEIYSSY